MSNIPNIQKPWRELKAWTGNLPSTHEAYKVVLNSQTKLCSHFKLKDSEDKRKLLHSD